MLEWNEVVEKIEGICSSHGWDGSLDSYGRNSLILNILTDIGGLGITIDIQLTPEGEYADSSWGLTFLDSFEGETFGRTDILMIVRTADDIWYEIEDYLAGQTIA